MWMGLAGCRGANVANGTDCPKIGHRAADDHVMAQWLTKLGKALTGEPIPIEVREALAFAQRGRVPVELESLPSGASLDEPAFMRGMAATIEQVRDDDLVISPPMVGTRRYPLATDERLRITFLAPAGRVSAEVRSGGRIKIPSGGDTVFYGYSLSLPTILMPADRRAEPRAVLAPDCGPPVEIHSLMSGATEPIRGVVYDISASGMKVSTRSSTSKLQPGQRVFLRTQLPEPVGDFGEMVRIAYIRPGNTAEISLIGLAYYSKIEVIGELVRQRLRERTKR